MDTKDPLKLEDNKESIRSYVYKEVYTLRLKNEKLKSMCPGFLISI